MNLKDEIIHHVFPGLSGTSIMLTLGEHFAYSVGVGVAVYCITHVISLVVRHLIKKIKCDNKP